MLVGGNPLRAECDGPVVKKKALHPAEQHRPDVLQQRQAWQDEVIPLDARRFVFLDESGAKTNMTRLYGRAPRGQRACDMVPNGSWHTTTMIAAIRLSGPQAPFVFEGAMDALAFRVYAAQVLAPTLMPGDIVVLDNLSSHKDKDARESILATGAQIRDLPPYSPDLNPIEMMWSKVKAFLRKSKARSTPQLTKAIGKALETITRQDAAGWLRKSGYSIN